MSAKSFGPNACCGGESLTCEEFAAYLQGDVTRPAKLTLEVDGGCLDGFTAQYSFDNIEYETGGAFNVIYIVSSPPPDISFDGCGEDLGYSGPLNITFRFDPESGCWIFYFAGLMYERDPPTYPEYMSIDVSTPGWMPMDALGYKVPIDIRHDTHEAVTNGQPCASGCNGSVIVSITE